MDLTTSYPRSVSERMAGVVMLARTADKAKAKAHGTLGDYHYNCPMDVAVFTFLGIDHETFLAAVTQGDAAAERLASEHAAKKSAAEIDAWNATFLARAPEPGSEGEAYFHELRGQVAPDRTDVTAWADLLDLDERREVPRKTAV
ncbi:MAG: hypothetical protein NVSMB59_10120 [Vulcanimicrobiaceae bacterium]